MIKSAKKLAIATLVVLTFIIYSVHQRSEGSQAVSQATKSSSSANTTTGSVIAPLQARKEPASIRMAYIPARAATRFTATYR